MWSQEVTKGNTLRLRTPTDETVSLKDDQLRKLHNIRLDTPDSNKMYSDAAGKFALKSLSCLELMTASVI